MTHETLIATVNAAIEGRIYKAVALNASVTDELVRLAQAYGENALADRFPYEQATAAAHVANIIRNYQE